MKKDTMMWLLENNYNGEIYGIFSSKVKALDSIVLWSVGGCHPYAILTSLGKIKSMTDHSEFIRIKYEDGTQHCMYLRPILLDNGAGITSGFRHAAAREARGDK